MDLGSTHGTFLNKQQLPPNVFCRVHSGHIFKMGVSTRLFVLQGPEEDQEPVSELSVSQIKEHKRLRELHDTNIDNFQEPNLELCNKKSTLVSSGINWGMSEDAEDENPSAENPFAIADDSSYETLNLDDPKKTLRGWFEREGYELNYQVLQRINVLWITKFKCNFFLQNCR